jgi:CBS domain-containing protein
MLQWQEIERKAMRASDLSGLRSLRDEVHEAFGELLPEVVSDATETINRLHDAFIRRSLAIAEERVRTSYPGVPPVSSFAVLLFGSGGRREQTLWSDQDNGLVYEPKAGADANEADRYMELLGTEFRSSLEEVGYPPCEGDVLVTNPAWRRTGAAWRDTVRSWIEEPEFETVRHLLIVGDARTIYGNEMLAVAMRTELAFRIEAHRDTILPRMAQNTLRYKVLVGLLGNLLTEPYGEDAGGIDLKYGAYIPMVNAIRLLSLAHRVTATSTLERIDALARCDGIPLEKAAAWKEAFRTVLKFRAMTPFRIEDGKYTTRGVIPAKLLTKPVKRELKDALRIGAELQRKVKKTFGTEGHL